MDKHSSNKVTFLAVGAATLIVIVGLAVAVYALTLDAGSKEPDKNLQESTHEHSP